MASRLIALILWLCLGAVPALGCSADDMLEFIGTLEAPRGYDTIYTGITHMPPRPVTSMSVGEVLEWQAEAARTSVSTASGRYQIIRPTLQGLVDQGVVSRSDRFDERTQDRLGEHLLREAGWGRPGLSAVEQANRVAGVWAALPKVSGAGRGQSAYEGIAGNRALTSPDVYLGLISCEIALEDAIRVSEGIRTVTLQLINVDRFLEQISEVAAELQIPLARAALALIAALAIIDFSLAFARAAINGDDLGTIVSMKFTKLIIVGFFVFLLAKGPQLVDLVSASAQAIADLGRDGFTFSFGALGREKMSATIAMIEQSRREALGVFVGVVVAAILMVLLGGLQLALIAYYYAQSFVIMTVALFGLGFGGFENTRTIALRFLKAFLGSALLLGTAMLTILITVEMLRTARQEAVGLTLAILGLMIEVLALTLVFAVPQAARKLAA
ncbi:hypothetical protein [Roseobacter sp. HKCCA0434]|uniref:hypothetical protein n=1 Tax=Roseobacter sp. HKCCA0434 TaxID=3079297 RepID=UPI002905D842|nr:hypothetical protein [Roseobacter sp. HKCCA0434]